MLEHSNHVGPRCKHLGILTAQTIGQTLEILDLTPVQSRVLNCVVRSQEKPPCQRDVEKFFRLSHPTVSGILSRLEEKGYITFREDLEDRRRKRIIPTEKALESFAQTTAAIERVERQLLEGFTPEERELFRDFLDRSIRNLGGEPGKWNKKEKCEP